MSQAKVVRSQSRSARHFSPSKAQRDSCDRRRKGQKAESQRKDEIVQNGQKEAQRKRAARKRSRREKAFR